MYSDLSPFLLIVEVTCNAFDDHSIMQRNMAQFYITNVQNPTALHDITYLKATHLTANNFSEAIKGKPDKIAPKVKKYIGLDQEPVAIPSDRTVRCAERYQWFVKTGGRDIAIHAVGCFSAFNDFRELAAIADCLATINGIDVVVIFRDVKDILTFRELRSIDEALGCATDNFPIYRDTAGNINVKWDHEYLYEAAGLLRAFPKANECRVVVFGRYPLDVKEVVIPRIADDEKYPGMRRSIISLGNMFQMLRDFYFGALLPELGHPRHTSGLPLRQQRLDRRLRMNVMQAVGL